MLLINMSKQDKILLKEVEFISKFNNVLQMNKMLFKIR